MGGELGNETYIDVLESWALSPPNFIFIGNDDFYTNLVWKSWCFLVFADISARSSRKKNPRIFHILFFVNVQCCVRVSASNFQVLTCNSDGARALGNIVRFFAGPARTRKFLAAGGTSSYLLFFAVFLIHSSIRTALQSAACSLTCTRCSARVHILPLEH